MDIKVYDFLCKLLNLLLLLQFVIIIISCFYFAYEIFSKLEVYNLW